MAFDVTLLKQISELGLSGGNMWTYGRTTLSNTDVAALGFFAGCGLGSRGANGVGMRLGDIVLVNTATGATLSTTGRVTLHNVLNSTANVASTTLSSGYNASYDITISAGSSF